MESSVDSKDDGFRPSVIKSFDDLLTGASLGDCPDIVADCKKLLRFNNFELCIAKLMAEMKVDPNNTSHKELLTQGIRAFHLEEFNTAVQALSQATEILVKEHGDDMHDSLGDVYFYYGKSLLELSRSEVQPLGEAIPKDADSDDDDDDDNDNEDEAAAAASEPQTAEDGEKMEIESEAQPSEGTSEAAKSSAVDEAAQSSSAGDAAKTSSSDEAAPSSSAAEAGPSSASDEAGPSTSTGKAQESTEDEEPSDLQVAWEVLELAKKIFTARGKAGETSLAETLIALGEISLENEKYEDAVNDITQGLNIQKTLFESDSRALAETYYKLGVVYGTNTQLDQAMSCFTEALSCLASKVAKLEAIERKSVDDEMEIRDIKDLIPVIEEKIADMKSYKEEVRNGVNSLLKGDDSSTSKANGVAGKPETSTEEKTEKPTEVVNNISHLVKRKRPRDSKDQEPDNYKPVEKQIC